MVKDSVNRCAKILLILGNLFFMLCGAALLGIGIWITQGDTTVLKFLGIIEMKGSHNIVSYLLIGVGVVMILIAFIGFAGACCENKCLLLTFFLFQLVIAILLIAGIAMSIMFKNEIYGTARDKMTKSLTTSYKLGSREYDIWNTLQTKFKCCAVRTGEFHIYSSTPWYSSIDKGEINEKNLPKVPDSCCKKGVECDTTKSADPTVNTGLHPDGCWNAITEFADKYSMPALIALIITIIILIFGMSLTMIIFCQLRRMDGVFV